MANKTHVIVLHGLGLNKFWMMPLASALKKDGYTVHNLTYPSTRLPIEEIVETVLVPYIEKEIPKDATSLNFVTHSMGGILVRYYHKMHRPPFTGRTVMLGPPNNGSEVADLLKDLKIFKWYFGPAGGELVTDVANSTPINIGPLNFEAGIIAGTQHLFHLYFGQKLPKPNDGLVTVESTKVDGMSDHICMSVDHSMMVMYPKVIDQALCFLKTGQFDHRS